MLDQEDRLELTSFGQENTSAKALEHLVERQYIDSLYENTPNQAETGESFDASVIAETVAAKDAAISSSELKPFGPEDIEALSVEQVKLFIDQRSKSLTYFAKDVLNAMNRESQR